MSDIALPSSYLSDLKRSIPTLVGIDNWPDWIDQIKTIANRLEIWIYLDPDKSDQLTEPTYEDQPSLEELDDPTRRDEESEADYQRRLDLFNENLPGRVTRLQLIASQTESRNRTLRKDYEKKKYSLLAIINLIDGSISKEFQVLLKGKEGDARERIKALKDHIRPDDQYETLAATSAFWTQARATGSRNWATWADQIKVAYIRCDRLTQKPIPKELAVTEFLGAIRDTFPAFYGPWNKERRTAGSKIDPIVLFSEFKAEALIKKTQSASPSVNAANAAKPKSPEGGRPRGRGKKSPIEKCPGCLVKHPRAQGTSIWWESCYAFQKTYGKAPNQMVRDWTVREGIKKNLKSWFEKHPDEKRKALSWNPSTEEGTQEDIIPGEGLTQQKTAYSLGRLELGADEWISDHRNPAWSEISDDESNSPTAASWISDEDGNALTPGSAESDEESSHWTEESRTYEDHGNRQTMRSQVLEHHGWNRTALGTCAVLPSTEKTHYSQPAKKKVVSQTEESQAKDSSGHCQTQASLVTDSHGNSMTSRPLTHEEVSQSPTTRLGSSDSHGRSRTQKSRTNEYGGNEQTIRPGPSESHGRNLTQRSRTRDKVSNRKTQGSCEAAAVSQKETTAPRAADQVSHDWTRGSRTHDAASHAETHGSRTYVEAGNSETTRSRDHDNNSRRKTARALTYDTDGNSKSEATSQINSTQTKGILRNAVIYDSGANCHVFNHIAWFKEDDQFDPTCRDLVESGGRIIRVSGKGVARIRVECPGYPSGRKVALTASYFIPSLHVSLVSMRRALDIGIFWDQTQHQLIYQGQVFAILQQQYDQFVLAEGSHEQLPAQVNTLGRLPKPPSRGDGDLWHRRLGHPSQRALAKLAVQTEGAKITGPLTYECEVCSTAKARREVSREIPRELPRGAGRAFSCDLHWGPGIGYNQHRYWVLFTCLDTGNRFIYTLKKRSDIREAFRRLRALLWLQFQIKIILLWTDGELALVKEVRSYLEPEVGMIVFISAPSTPTQNGSGERSGAVVKTRIRAIHLDSGLPDELWVETAKLAVYLLNRTPIEKDRSWKTPYERWWNSVRSKSMWSEIPANLKPRINHLRVTGCIAYPMTTDALEHIKSNKPLPITAARAHIGYLVGYRGSHQYLIWVPSKGRVKVIVSANVTFNEAVTYDPAREEEALTSAVRDDQVLTDLAAEDLGVSTEGYLQDIGLDLGSSNESQSLEPAVQDQIRQNDLYSEERLQGIDKIGSEGEEDHEDQYYPTPAPSRAATLDPPEQSDRLGFAVRETLEAIPDDPDEHEEK